MTSHQIPRYDRPFEPAQDIPDLPRIAACDLDDVLAQSDHSAGACDLVRALVRLARPAVFPGGGVGLEYGALLKTAARPDLLSSHVTEVAQHLIDARVDILFVPGMSGYPIGAMYAMASGIPALLLKKQSWNPSLAASHPPGSFIIPSYSGNADTIISADIPGARDILTAVVARQLASQGNEREITINVRIAGADEIIDKATMATAITENAPLVVRSILNQILIGFSSQIGSRSVTSTCEVVVWVTPILKQYGESESVLATRFGIVPFAGITITAIQLDPPAIGIAGIGLVQLENQQ